MGILSGLLGHVSEVDESKVEKELSTVLVDGEVTEKAYRLVRDLVVFTNKRMIMIDKQSMLGKKREYSSIPYRSVVRFSKETQGNFDLDAEIKFWLSGNPEPFVIAFQKDKNVHDVYRLLGKYVLG